jgi:hypothetical protein
MDRVADFQYKAFFPLSIEQALSNAVFKEPKISGDFIMM